MVDKWQESMRRQYVCKRVAEPLDINASDPDPGWDQLSWSEPFVERLARLLWTR